MQEIWKDIKGYEGLYQVSNFGRIKSCERLKWNRFSYIRIEDKLLKNSNDKYGYHVVQLNKDSIGKTYKVHRLVAETFIPNPNNYPCINHKDENKKNNRVDNLEWCTVAYNNSYNSRNKIVSKKLKKPIRQLDLDGNLIKVWDSAIDIYNELGYNNGTIGKCCKGIFKQSYGYKWEYYD